MLPCLAQVSVVLQQKKEEALKAAEEAEAMARSLQKESESATNATVETDEADAKDTQEVLFISFKLKQSFCMLYGYYIAIRYGFDFHDDIDI